MALGDNTTSVARGNDARGRKPYLLSAELNFATAASDKGTALAANDVIPGLTIPANTLIMCAGFEVTSAHTGTSTDTDFDFGITGGDLDNFVDGLILMEHLQVTMLLRQDKLLFLLVALQIPLTLKFRQ